MRNRLVLLAGCIALLLLAASCAGDGDDGVETADNGKARGKNAAAQDAKASGEKNGHSLSVVAPKNGAEVESPLIVEVATSVPLGEPGSDFHLHVFFDGHKDDYEIKTSKRFAINVPAGRHTITVLLRKPDHSSAGPQARLTVEVAATSDTPHDDGGYDS